jgi:hypothetical protein
MNKINNKTAFIGGRGSKRDKFSNNKAGKDKFSTNNNKGSKDRVRV